MPVTPITEEHKRIIYNILTEDWTHQCENDGWYMRFADLLEFCRDYDRYSDVFSNYTIPEEDRTDMRELAKKQPNKIIGAAKSWLKEFLKLNKKKGITGYIGDDGVYVNDREDTRFP